MCCTEPFTRSPWHWRNQHQLFPPNASGSQISFSWASAEVKKTHTTTLFSFFFKGWQMHSPCLTHVVTVGPELSKGWEELSTSRAASRLWRSSWSWITAPELCKASLPGDRMSYILPAQLLCCFQLDHRSSLGMKYTMIVFLFCSHLLIYSR